LNVLFATAELYPFVKTGGLADISAALPAALAASSCDIRIIMPGYSQALARCETLHEIAHFETVLGYDGVRLLERNLPGSFIKVWLVDCPKLYNRAGTPYQDEAGADWPDNHLRFAVFNHVAAMVANGTAGWVPDVIHANDWHCGLLPLLLSTRSGTRPATVFTIHNLAYQGLFDAAHFDSLALPAIAFQAIEFYARLSFIKAGIGAADAITTVSPTYASEIVTAQYGCGLDGLLRERERCITGILNGADYGVWDPGADPYITHNYTSQSVNLKHACKRAIQNELGLVASSEAPLLAFMSRLVDQKMPDLVLQALPSLLADGMQFALVGEGDQRYQQAFKDLAARYPGQVAVEIRYQEDVAHRLLAGADMLLHPSLYEPCGLVPIYALRYGTIPVVRKSGGMADTVIDATPEALKSGNATGFCFESATLDEFVSCTRRAASVRKQEVAWRRLQRNAMAQDFSWRNSATTYAGLYASLIGRNSSEAIRNRDNGSN
jgi:starch synthase